MAHGAPDYSNVRKEEFVYRMDDMAELVARQGNLVSLDRRGETIFLESFRHGIDHWGQRIRGTGAAIELSTDEFVSSGFSCKLVAGSDDSRQARIHKHLPYLRVAKMGVEIRMNVGTGNSYIDLQQQFFNKPTAYYTGLRYNYVDHQLLVRRTLTTWDVIASGIKRPQADQAFIFMKMVCDFELGEYVYVKFNDVEVDVSGTSVYSFTTTADQVMSILLELYSQSGQNGYVWVDNIIVTRND